MLQAIRDRSQSYIAYFIVGLMIIPFALWGIQEYVGGGSLQAVAEVNGEEIMVNDFNRTYGNYREQQRQRLANIFKGNLNNPLYKQLMNEATMKQTVVDGMVESQLLTMTAFDQGMTVSDAELDQSIINIPAFQTDGKFDPEVFKRSLKLQGQTSAGFKGLLQQDRIVEQLLQGIALTAAVTNNDVQEKLRLENQQRDMGYITIPASRYVETVAITEEDIQAYYDKNTAQYQTPERLIVNYISIDVAGLTDLVDVNEDELQQYYADNSAEFKVDTVIVQAGDVLKRIRSGESFSELAKEFSNDPVSAEQGGDLGLFGKNVMDKAFEDTVFAMQVGDVSEPVKTSFGYHLIKLTGIEGDQRRASHILFTKDNNADTPVKPFAEVRAEIETQVRLRAAEDMFADLYDQLANLAFENPTTLDVAADELQLKVKTSEEFGRDGGLGILSDPRVIEAAFSKDVLEQGNNSELLELSDTSVVVLRVKEHKRPQPRPLEDVRTLVTAQVKKQKATDEAKRIGEEIQQRILKGESFDELAKTYSFEWKKPGKIDRSNRDLDAALTQALFKMSKPDAEKPVYNGITLRSGDYVLIGLFDVDEGDINKQNETVKSKARAALLREYRTRELAAYKKQLKNEAEIKVYNNNF